MTLGVMETIRFLYEQCKKESKCEDAKKEMEQLIQGIRISRHHFIVTVSLIDGAKVGVIFELHNIFNKKIRLIFKVSP